MTLTYISLVDFIARKSLIHLLALDKKPVIIHRDVNFPISLLDLRKLQRQDIPPIMSNLPSEPEFEQAYKGTSFVFKTWLFESSELTFTDRACFNPRKFFAFPEEPGVQKGP